MVYWFNPWQQQWVARNSKGQLKFCKTEQEARRFALGG